MADTFTNKRKSLCKGFRRGPQFGLWIWCIVIKCLFSLPCIFSTMTCLGVDLPVALYPSSMIYVRYGDPLEIFCVAEKDSANNLDFALGGRHIDSEIVNSTTRRLYIERVEKQVSTYYCRNNVTKKQCTTRVLVDLPPSNVTNFSCISRNLDILTCNWTTPAPLSKTNYTITYVFNNVPAIALNGTRIGNSNTYTCSWDTTSTPRYKQMEDVYNFELTACNYFGCNKQNFSVNHFSIVKPEPPINLRVVNNTAHGVLLQWTISNNIYYFLPCPVVHRIEYQIGKIDNTSYFRTVDISDLPPRNRTYKFWLSNLPYAHMLYEVRIYIKSAYATEERFWSDYTYVLFTTASEKPQRPPDTIIGAFDQSVYQHTRVVNVYWKQLEEYEEAGANFTYKVVAMQGTSNQQTLVPDKNKSLSYVVLNEASLGPIDIHIWSVNTVGSSVNHSHLYIPPKEDTEALEVHSFTKLAYENGTYKLLWIGVKDIDNYTLFWCQHNTTEICVGRLNFTTLDPYKNTHVIELPRNNRYQFAISANRGTKTSGMTWAACDISKDAIPTYGFPVKVNHDAAGKSFVKITWTMSCTLQEGIIKGYKLSYCPVYDTSNECDKTYGNMSEHYVDDSKQMHVNITNLTPYTTYIFTLALNTTYGLKTIENASTGVTTTEDTPSSPRNVIISNIQYNSLNISWEPPLHKNGIIGRYVILNNGEGLSVATVTEKDKDAPRLSLNIGKLDPFTNYSLSVIACNNAIDSCSSPTDAITVRTRIGPPSTLLAPVVKTNPGYIEWQPPYVPGGTVDRYEIRRVKNDNVKTAEIFNTTNLSYSLPQCEGEDDSESYQVRAVNLDEEPYHGVLFYANSNEVIMPERHEGVLEFAGNWSYSSSVKCRSRDGIAMILIFLAVCILIGVMYASIKLYKKVRKMEDIKPVLPSGLGIPEKDISKYAYGGLYSTNKEDKPSSDEMLLLPNSRTTVSTPENKQDTDNNCGSSDHTDSTALSDTSHGPVDRHASTSDDGSDCSLHLEVEPVGETEKNVPHEEEESSNSETDNSRDNSPCFDDKAFKSSSGYVQSVPAPQKSPLAKPVPQPTSSSYVMAGLTTPIFTTGVVQPMIPSQPPASSGYVRPEDAQARSILNFPKLRPSPTAVFGSESLPTMPTLPQPVSQKHGADSSYIQLQSLDALTSHKQPVRTAVPLKPPTSSGYVSPGDAVINKHLNNMLSGGQLAEESAILDPTMSPDAYCRFSWSTDPANDNLHSLLTDSHMLKSSKN